MKVNSTMSHISGSLIFLNIKLNLSTILLYILFMALFSVPAFQHFCFSYVTSTVWKDNEVIEHGLQTHKGQKQITRESQREMEVPQKKNDNVSTLKPQEMS